MEDLKKVIHKDFYQNTGSPVLCDTVGEVIEHLSRLPKDLNVEQGFGDAVRIVVYNIDSENPHVEFDEID
jgi:hypothetical protein